MRIPILISGVLLLLAAPALAVPSITILADSSVSVAVAKLAREYTRTHGVTVNTSFITREKQWEQISDGGAGDVLITHDQKWIDSLKTQGVVDHNSQMPFANGQLALVGPRGTQITYKASEEFPTAAIMQAIDYEPGFAIGHPETFVEGGYAKEALHALQAQEDLEPYTLYIKEMPQMLDLVANRGAYGLFLYSTALSWPDLFIIGALPESSHKPINYEAVVLAGDNMDAARGFLRFVASPNAKRIIEGNGLIAVR